MKLTLPRPGGRGKAAEVGIFQYLAEGNIFSFFMFPSKLLNIWTMRMVTARSRFSEDQINDSMKETLFSFLLHINISYYIMYVHDTHR